MRLGTSLTHSNRPALLFKKKERRLIQYPPGREPTDTAASLSRLRGNGLTGGLQRMTTCQAAGFQDVRPSITVSLIGGEKFRKDESYYHYFSSGALESSERVLVLLLGPRTLGRAGTRGYLGWQAAPQPRSLPHDTSARSPVRGPYSRARATPEGRLGSK